MSSRRRCAPWRAKRSVARLRSIASRLRHVGFRGSCLLAFAFIDIVYSTSLVTAPPQTIETNATYRWFNAVLPLGFWAACWAAVAVVCTVCAFMDDDRLGFVAAIGIKVVWCLGSLAGWLISDVSLGGVGIWIGLAFLVWRIAEVSEPAIVNKDH